MNDAVTQEIMISAPIHTVWDVVVKPEKWFADSAAFEAQPGKKGTLSWEGLGDAPIEVVTADQPHTFAFYWVAPDEETAGTDNKTLITFKLVEVTDGTQVRVTESGFSGLTITDAQKADLMGKHTSGWTHLLGKLGEYAEGIGSKTE